MPKTVTIVLTYAGGGTGPFDLYSDSNVFASPFETGISKASLLAGYTSFIVPDDATQIRIMSSGGGACVGTFIDLSIPISPTPTPTPSPLPYFLGDINYNPNPSLVCSPSSPGSIFIYNVYGNGTTLCNSTTFTNAVFASFLPGTYSYISYGGFYINIQHTGTSVANAIGPCVTCPSPSVTPSITPTITPTPSVTPSIPSVYNYTVVLDNSIFTICGGGTTTVYSNSSVFTPGMQIFYDAALLFPVVGYDYVQYLDNGVTYNLNTSNGVVGSNTGYSC